MNTATFRSFSLCLFLLLILSRMEAQGVLDCSTPQATHFLHANELRLPVRSDGGLFFNIEGVGDGYGAPYQGDNSPSAMFSSALWLGGFAPGDHLKMAANTTAVTSGARDFSTGPLDPITGTTAIGICQDWDRVFSVRGYEIYTHIADFQDNQQINNRLYNIYAWPGKGNPHFLGYVGFELPSDEQDLAPFFDQNGDGIYDPNDGDYPAVPNSLAIPGQITFSIFNDNGNDHSETYGEALQAEIHFTNWAFACEEPSNPLNRTFFSSYRVINRAAVTIDSFHLGLWKDINIGGWSDDYLGSLPELNTTFSYNKNPIDDASCGPCYGSNPPVQALTMLNEDLSSFTSIAIVNNGITPVHASPPVFDNEYFRYLSGSWRSGEPITYGSFGHQTGEEETPFIFSGNPNNPDDWSMYQIGMSAYYRFGISTAFLGQLQPGEAKTVDVAWILVKEPDLNHIEQVDALIDKVPEVQDMYDSNFAAACTFTPICTEDCVWPGDTNNDGIVEYDDLLPIGTALQASGPPRNDLQLWNPYTAAPWDFTLPSGTNVKHVDANGDGSVQSDDRALIDFHYGEVTPSYVEPVDIYKVGPELAWSLAQNTTSFENLEPGVDYYAQLDVIDLPNLYGLAFQIEGHKAWLEDLRVHENLSSCTSCWEINTEVAEADGSLLEIDYAITKNDGLTDLSDHVGLQFRFVLKGYPDWIPATETELRVKNITAVDADGNLLDLGATDLRLFLDPQFVGTEEAGQQEDILVYPIPSQGELTIDARDNSILAWTVYGIDGKVISEQEVGGVSLTTAQIPSQYRGVLILEIQTEEGTFYRKISQ
ncbi:MAG: T9SS type A sorting domain-containing protein [Bacteroidota bacterium]